MSPWRLGALIAIAVLAADQLAKALVLHYFGETGWAPLPLGPLINLTLHWNRGISFSFFSMTSANGQIILVLFAVIATIFLMWWLARCRSPVAAIGLGAIIGGALGNVADRLFRGAVVDFLDLHMLGWHLFVFNLADAAINCGVVLLVLDVIAGGGEARNRTVTPS